MKVLGAVNYYKINDIFYEHYNWGSYKMFFMKLLRPNLNLWSKSIWVCNTHIGVRAHSEVGKRRSSCP